MSRKLIGALKTLGTLEAASTFKLSEVAPTVGHVWTATNIDGTGGWAAGGGGGDGSPKFTFVTKTSNYDMTSSDSGIEVDASGGAVTVQLPVWNASFAGKWFAFQSKSSASTVTIRAKATSGDTLDGVSEGTFTLGTGDRALVMAGPSGNAYFTW